MIKDIGKPLEAENRETLVFRTPGLIDLRAFTVMGFNAKPNTPNPIGFFGTGLKYSVAVLLRLGYKMVVYIGRDKYTFFEKKVDFRGKEFGQVWMRSERWKLRARNIELPFTTEYGKNWEPWMVFRELESNTRDENGETYVLGERDKDGPVDDANQTVILVDHPGVIEAFRKGGTFIDETAHPVVSEDHALKVRATGGTELFYRGIRAKDTTKPTLFTYDFVNTHGLTEDRTLKDEYWARHTLGSFVATCDNPDVIRKVITAPEENWEHGLEIPKYVQPSAAFHQVMAEKPRGVSIGVSVYYSRYDPRPVVQTISPWQGAPRPWRLDGDVIVDAKGNELFREPLSYEGRWDILAKELIEVGRVFQQAPPPEPEEPDPELAAETEFDNGEVAF